MIIDIELIDIEDLYRFDIRVNAQCLQGIKSACEITLKTETTMSTPTKPTIIVIPGSFSLLSPYATVISGLESHGYPVHGIELETVGRRDKAPGMYDDAAKVAKLALQLADAGKDVVLVAHSYGGLVACEAAKGLAQSVREKEGKQGGIVRIVFVASVVPREGQSMRDVMGDAPADIIALEVLCLLVDFAMLTRQRAST
jgi:pimeloyl-ACP methyl ester carboxylesterase